MLKELKSKILKKTSSFNLIDFYLIVLLIPKLNNIAPNKKMLNKLFSNNIISYNNNYYRL